MSTILFNKFIHIKIRWEVHVHIIFYYIFREVKFNS